MNDKRKSQRTKDYSTVYRLARCTSEILVAFQGIEEPEKAQYAEFQFFGGDEFLLIVEPTTLQIHDKEGASWGIFQEQVDINMEAYARGILQMVAEGKIGSTGDFERVLNLEQLT